MSLAVTLLETSMATCRAPFLGFAIVVIFVVVAIKQEARAKIT